MKNKNKYLKIKKIVIYSWFKSILKNWIISKGGNIVFLSFVRYHVIRNSGGRKKDNYVDEEQEIKCVCGLLQQIARITFKNGEIFNPFEYLYTGQTAGVDSRQISNITGFITIPDTKFQTLNTKNG